MEVVDGLSDLETRIKEDVDILKSQSFVTSRDFEGMWCPAVCPITLLPFFMWIEHPEDGWVPTYGGPFDSYTIPEPEDLKDSRTIPGPVDLKDGNKRYDVEYTRRRFDHDEGCWVEGSEVVQERVVFEETLIELDAWE